MRKIIGCLLLISLLVGCSGNTKDALQAKKEFEKHCIEGNNTLSLTITVGMWGTSVSSTCIYNGGK
jgi:hypothetical protein